MDRMTEEELLAGLQGLVPPEQTEEEEGLRPRSVARFGPALRRAVLFWTARQFALARSDAAPIFCGCLLFRVV